MLVCPQFLIDSYQKQKKYFLLKSLVFLDLFKKNIRFTLRRAVVELLFLRWILYFGLQLSIAQNMRFWMIFQGI